MNIVLKIPCSAWNGPHGHAICKIKRCFSPSADTWKNHYKSYGGKQSNGNIRLKGTFPITGTPFIICLSGSRDNRKLCIVAMPRTREAIRMLCCFSLMAIWTFFHTFSILPSWSHQAGGWCHCLTYAQAWGWARAEETFWGPVQPDAGWATGLAPQLWLPTAATEGIGSKAGTLGRISAWCFVKLKSFYKS